VSVGPAITLLKGSSAKDPTNSLGAKLENGLKLPGNGPPTLVGAVYAPLPGNDVSTANGLSDVSNPDFLVAPPPGWLVPNPFVPLADPPELPPPDTWGTLAVVESFGNAISSGYKCQISIGDSGNAKSKSGRSGNTKGVAPASEPRPSTNAATSTNAVHLDLVIWNHMARVRAT
jgi:hypothetical protein